MLNPSNIIFLLQKRYPLQENTPITSDEKRIASDFINTIEKLLKTNCEFEADEELIFDEYASQICREDQIESDDEYDDAFSGDELDSEPNQSQSQSQRFEFFRFSFLFFSFFCILYNIRIRNIFGIKLESFIAIAKKTKGRYFIFKAQGSIGLLP